MLQKLGTGYFRTNKGPDYFVMIAGETKWSFISVTRWLYYLFNVWPCRPIKIFQIVKNICQSGFKMLPTLTKP